MRRYRARIGIAGGAWLCAAAATGWLSTGLAQTLPDFAPYSAPMARPDAQPIAEPFETLAPAGADGALLRRGARAAPLRYRVIAVPGTGCRSLAPSAERLFAGLLHAEVWLLQKPDLSPAGAASPDDCSPSFIAADRLSAWQQRALDLVDAARREADLALPRPLPLVLVGFSEGAELLPQLARALPATVLLVIIGNAGLDPAQTVALQARRLGHEAAWRALIEQATGREAGQDAPASSLLQGRDRRYWQDLLRWPLLEPLLADPRPLLQVRGGRDALVPAEAYALFEASASTRAGGVCSVVFAQADHELREPGADRLQRVWAWIEAIARQRAGWSPDCAAIQANASGF